MAKKRELTEEQRQALRDRLALARAARQTKKSEEPAPDTTDVPQPALRLDLVPYAVDIRDIYPEDLDQLHLNKVLADLEAGGKRLSHLFCTDEQGRSINDKNLTLPKNVIVEAQR